MAKTPEGVVKDGIKKFLKDRGAWFFMPVSNGMGQVGIPDFIICYRGLFVAIEAKAPGKKATTTPNQRRVIDEILGADGFAFVVDDPSELEVVFNSIDIYCKLENRNAQIDPSQT